MEEKVFFFNFPFSTHESQRKGTAVAFFPALPIKLEGGRKKIWKDSRRMVNFINSTLCRSRPMRKYGKCAKIQNLRVAYYVGDILEISKADRIRATINIQQEKRLRKFSVCDFSKRIYLSKVGTSLK